MKFLTRVGVSLVALATLLPANLAFAGAIELKLAYFVGDQHAMSQWLVKWANNLERDSGGRITVKRFPGSQMGPVQQHYDFVRTGQADVAWFLHGATPGRFPLTEIVQVPYLADSAVDPPGRRAGHRHLRGRADPGMQLLARFGIKLLGIINAARNARGIENDGRCNDRAGGRSPARL